MWLSTARDMVVGLQDFFPLWMTLGLLSVILYLLYLYLCPSDLGKIPGPNLIQNFTFLLRAIKFETFQLVSDLHKEYGPIAKLSWFGQQVLVVTGSDEINYVLNNSKIYDRSHIQERIFDRMLGRSLVTTRGLEHDIQRKVLNPIFHKNIIRDFLPKFQKHSSKLLAYWNKGLNEAEEDYTDLRVQKDIARLTMDVISDCMFSKHAGLIKSSNNSHTKAASTIASQSTDASLRTILPFLKYLPLKSNKNYEQACQLRRKLIQDRIDDKRKMMSYSDEEEDKLNDMLSHILRIQDENGEKLTDEELHSHLLTIVAAGYETTSLGLTWALYCLANTPATQDRLREEIHQFFPDRQKPIVHGNVEKMQYLDCVVKESLRLYTPAPAMVKENLIEDVLGGYRIPAGTCVSLWVGVAHRSAENWSEPEEFKPERFMDKRIPIKPGSYYPFGFGKNFCIGHRFAILQIKVALATLLRELSFSEVPGYKPQLKYVLTLSPRPSLRLRVKSV